MSSSQQNVLPIRHLPTLSPASTAQTSMCPEILLIDSEVTTAKLAPLLSGSYRVLVSTGLSTARACLERNSVDVIVTDIELPDGAAMNLCREVKARPKPPAVLVTTAQVDRVPEVLEAHCDGVLLKPFAPNLLFARIGRILRTRRQHAGRGNSMDSGTNRHWATVRCPYCELHGVTSFEFASHRRAWYACGGCKKVWLGKRQE